MDVEQLKEEVKSGRITAEQLVAVIEMLFKRLAALEKENEELKRQIREGDGGATNRTQYHSFRAWKWGRDFFPAATSVDQPHQA